MRKYGESKTTRIMMATVPHVTAWAGRTEQQVDGFLFDWVYHVLPVHCTDRLSSVGPLSDTDESAPYNITFHYVRNFNYLLSMYAHFYHCYHCSSDFATSDTFVSFTTVLFCTGGGILGRLTRWVAVVRITYGSIPINVLTSVLEVNMTVNMKWLSTDGVIKLRG